MRTLQYIWKSSCLKVWNEKTGLFAVVIFIFCWTANRPLRFYCENVSYPVNWCVFPFLLNQSMFLLIFCIGLIYVNSDVPFMQHIHMYEVIRTGRKRWVIGQISGIILRTALLVLYTVVCTIVSLLPRIEWSNDWGRLLKTAAMTNAGVVYKLKYQIIYDIFQEFTPLSFMGISILICVLVGSFLGIFMFVLGVYSANVFSVTGGMALILALFIVMEAPVKFRYTAAYFVPTVWLKIALLETGDFGFYWLPSLTYMFSFLLIGIGIMTVLILWRIRSMEFHWENEDI